MPRFYVSKQGPTVDSEKMNFEGMEFETRRKELNGFTFDRLKEMCVERHIDFSGKNKSELIDLLCQFMEFKSGDTAKDSSQLGVTGQPEVNVEIVKMLIQMQDMQVGWIAQ